MTLFSLLGWSRAFYMLPDDMDCGLVGSRLVGMPTSHWSLSWYRPSYANVASTHCLATFLAVWILIFKIYSLLLKIVVVLPLSFYVYIQIDDDKSRHI